MRSSELGSVRSLRRFPSVGTKFAAVVSRASIAQQYPYIGSCIDVRRSRTRSFSVASFTQPKKKCLQKLVLSLTSSTYYWLIVSARAASCYGKSMAVASMNNNTLRNNTLRPLLRTGFNLLGEVEGKILPQTL